MSFVDIFGWVTAVGTALFSLPQLLRLVLSRTSAGLSLVSWQLVVAAAASWTLHGFRVDAGQIIAPNLAVALFSFLIVQMISRDRGRSPWRDLALPLAVAAVAVGVDRVFGSTAFGFAVLGPQAVGSWAQLRDMMRLPNLMGVSLPTLTISAVLQWMWLIWGINAPEYSVIVAAGVMSVLASLNAGYLLLRRRGRLTPKSAAEPAG